jgi:hypothetical protein
VGVVGVAGDVPLVLSTSDKEDTPIDGASVPPPGTETSAVLECTGTGSAGDSSPLPLDLSAMIVGNQKRRGLNNKQCPSPPVGPRGGFFTVLQGYIAARVAGRMKDLFRHG